MSQVIYTPPFRVSYPSVYKAKLNELSGKNEYSLVALFKKGENLAVLEKAMMAACQKRWGADQAKWPKNIRSPIRDQGERGKENDKGSVVLPAGYEKGAKMMNLKRGVDQGAPGVVDKKTGNQPIVDPSEFYAGCWAIATVTVYTYPKPGKTGVLPGVSFGLGNIQKVADGEPMGAMRTKATEDFAPIEGVEETAEAGADATSMFT